VSHGFSSYHRRRASPHAQCGAVGGQDGGRSPGQDDPAGEDERDERTGQSQRSAGAYGASMSSNYNSRPRTAEVMVDGDKAHLIRRREALNELWQLESLLP